MTRLDANQMLSDVPPSRRYRKMSEFTRELDTLTRKYGLALYGARVEPIDLSWDGPDAEKWEQYALNEDDVLVRGFWDARLGGAEQ
jgi:hypothetical protein